MRDIRVRHDTGTRDGLRPDHLGRAILCVIGEIGDCAAPVVCAAHDIASWVEDVVVSTKIETALPVQIAQPIEREEVVDQSRSQDLAQLIEAVVEVLCDAAWPCTDAAGSIDLAHAVQRIVDVGGDVAQRICDAREIALVVAAVARDLGVRVRAADVLDQPIEIVVGALRATGPASSRIEHLLAGYGCPSHPSV